jgi:hypothetical protein
MHLKPLPEATLLIAQGGAAKSLSSAFALKKRQSWSPSLPKGI